ncbi:MAG: HAD hydrolase-like protein [Propionibacteriaceae bacterium]|jgi:pyrophosphatase PpaX|nr:HAD hydrolase-like protein [Propionibacteriaceae bacterium]
MALRWPVVLFDFDGTVADTIELIVSGYQYAFRTVLGREWDEAEIKTWIGSSLSASLGRAAPERAERLFEVYHAWNREHTERLVRNYPGLPGLIWDLVAAGARCGIVTSRRRISTDPILALLGLDRLLPVLVADGEVERPKPQPDPIWAALAALEAEPEQAVYVGDTVFDLRAAQAAAVPALGVTWGAGTAADLAACQPLALVADADQLRSWLLPDPAP